MNKRYILACVQTSPISFVSRVKHNEIGNGEQVRYYRLFGMQFHAKYLRSVSQSEREFSLAYAVFPYP